MLTGLFVLRDDNTMFPTYDSIVVDHFRVQKHILLYEQVPLATEILGVKFVRIVDIPCSLPQLTDKGIAGCYNPGRR